MKTGKFGVKLWFYAAAAFLFGVLDLYLGIIAVAAFAIIAEKDKWLNNQVMQALILYLIYCLLIVIMDWTLGGLVKLLVILEAFSAASIIGLITNIIKGIIYVAYVVMAIIAIFRCISAKDGVPFIAKTSRKLLDLSTKTDAQVNDDTKIPNSEDDTTQSAEH